MKNKYLSPHFTYNEFVISQTAIRKGIDNTPTPEILARMATLCVELMEKVRALKGFPISVSSGYRCDRLNRAVGGSGTSQHRLGEACDFVINGLTVEEAYQLIKNSGIEFDQLIQEFDSWIHISFRKGKNRRICTRATTGERRTIYTPDL